MNMKDRNNYWKNYYQKKVKPDKQKMEIRRERTNKLQAKVIAIKLKKTTFQRIIRELKKETAKKLMEEVLNYAIE